MGSHDCLVISERECEIAHVEVQWDMLAHCHFQTTADSYPCVVDASPGLYDAPDDEHTGPA